MKGIYWLNQYLSLKIANALSITFCQFKYHHVTCKSNIAILQYKRMSEYRGELLGILQKNNFWRTYAKVEKTFSLMQATHFFNFPSSQFDAYTLSYYDMRFAIIGTSDRP